MSERPGLSTARVLLDPLRLFIATHPNQRNNSAVTSASPTRFPPLTHLDDDFPGLTETKRLLLGAAEFVGGGVGEALRRILSRSSTAQAASALIQQLRDDDAMERRSKRQLLLIIDDDDLQGIEVRRALAQVSEIQGD
jgi:hypothetical protein